ncbi:MAG: hypothetical protein ACRELY_12265 [Polyangiaceae bacterium]
MMRRRRPFLMALLAVGTIAGYASGFASMHCHSDRRAAFEQHVADVCVAAADRAKAGK